MPNVMLTVLPFSISYFYLRFNIGSFNVFFPQVVGSKRINFIFKILSNIHRPKQQLRKSKSPFRKIKNESFMRKGVHYTFSVTLAVLFPYTRPLC